MCGGCAPCLREEQFRGGVGGGLGSQLCSSHEHVLLEVVLVSLCEGERSGIPALGTLT